MTRCLVICPDPSLRQSLLRGLAEAHGLTVLRDLDHHPQPLEAGRFLDSLRPQVVFIAAGDRARFAATVRCLEQLAPALALVGFDQQATAADLVEAMHLGLREFIAAPFTPDRLSAAMARLLPEADPEPVCHPRHRTYAFLPAKAGVGASTLATHTALAFAQRQNGNTLLMDLDMAAGLIGFSLGLPNELSTWDPLRRHQQMDDAAWRSLVARHGALDVLPAPAVAFPERVLARETRRLVSFVQRRYPTTVLDLAGAFDEEAFETIRRAHTTFLVTTPEVNALRLAHERLQQLRAENLDYRVELLVNRSGRVSREMVEDVLGYPVYFEFPNQYDAIQYPYQAHGRHPQFTRRFDAFVATILGEPALAEPQPLLRKLYSGQLCGDLSTKARGV